MGKSATSVVEDGVDADVVVDSEAEVCIGGDDGGSDPDTNGTDGASRTAGMACRFSGYSPLARNPLFRWADGKASVHS